MPNKGGKSSKGAGADEQFDRSSSQDYWGEEGSQTLDDSRSWCSQKSDAGDLHYSLSSLRSTGSVGSHESGGRYYHRGVHHGPAAHLINSETRFPPAMSYASDAQRSDVATVCSGSVVEDIEIESVMSQEDAHNVPASSALHASPPSSERNAHNGYHRASLADAPLQQNTIVPLKGGSTHTVASLSNHQTERDMGDMGAVASLPPRQMAESGMGPPLSRALLLQKAEIMSSQPGPAKSLGSHAGSDGGPDVHSDDCGGSLDVETHSVHSQEDSQGGENHGSKNAVKFSSRASSVKSFSSYTGSDSGAQGDTDDCGGSLDVETHSVGTRSIHSQDDAPNAETGEAPNSDAPGEDSAPVNPLFATETADNGRRSPGGTIYKGRGTRRYQGRYMHLPLKRFHQNGVHLDAIDKPATAASHSQNNELRNGPADDWREPPGKDSRRRPPERSGRYRQRPQGRSRSRSRSPDDAKPRGDGPVNSRDSDRFLAQVNKGGQCNDD